MKKKAFALLLVLCLLLAAPAAALGPGDFQQGRLSGVTAASDGSLLVTDTFNKVIWRVSGNSVTRFAGAIGVADLSGEPMGVYHDDLTDKSYFMEPWDIAPYLQGYAVSDAAANVIRYIANGRVYTLAGTGRDLHSDGSGKAASFSRPTGLAADTDGTLFVAETGTGSIRAIDTKGNVTTVATGLNGPTGICCYGGALYVAETGRCRIVRVTPDGAIEPFAGVSSPAEDMNEYYGGYADGPAASALFDHPQGVAAGEDGTIYVADSGNGAVRAIHDGRVFTLSRSAASALMPATPRGLLAQGDTLSVTDQFAGNILTLSVAQKSYVDVAPGSWYAPAIAAATRDGITDGVDATHFDPDGTMNRAMFVTMLSRTHLLADGNAVIDGDASFPDVAADDWFGAPVRWAVANGIVEGYDDGTFKPAADITRQELVAMLYRYAKAQGMIVEFSDNSIAAFSDAADAALWASDALRWGCSHGILRGDSLGNLTPAAPATRAQALTMLLNFMNAFGV